MKEKTVDPIENAPIADDTEAVAIEPVDTEKEDMQHEIERLIKENISLRDRYADERQAHARECQVLNDERINLHKTIEGMRSDMAKSHERERKATQRRHGSIPRLVLFALVSLVALAIPYFLQSLSVIGPQLSFTIQCGLFMAIAWCMALIWERSR